jgi:hypothetical protein
LIHFAGKIFTTIAAGSNAAMNGSHLCKGWKHWRKSPASVSLDHSLYHRFLDTRIFDLASSKAIQTQAIISSQPKITKGGRA